MKEEDKIIILLSGKVPSFFFSSTNANAQMHFINNGLKTFKSQGNPLGSYRGLLYLTRKHFSLGQRVNRRNITSIRCAPSCTYPVPFILYS